LPSIHADERPRLVRRNTVLLAFAGLTSAFVFEGAGFRVLGVGVAVVVLAVMVSVLRMRQPPAPLAVQR
jgi:hypothetical protein